jgi:hypothetical protein
VQWKDFKLALILTPLLLLAGVITLLVFYRALTPAVMPALRFDGSNRVEIASTPMLEFGTQAFSVSFWFRTTTTNKNITFPPKRASAAGVGWGIFGQGDNQFLYYAAGCSSPMSSPQNYRDGRWHHLAVVRNVGRVEIRYDGVLVGSGPERCDHRDQNPLLVGMDGELGHHLEGEVAELHLYNTALTPEQLAAEWNDGKGSRKSVAGSSLIAGYHFDEVSGDLAQDFSGAGHNGVLVNQPLRTRERR